MRILFVSPTAMLGGAERVLLSVMEALGKGNSTGSLVLILPEYGPLLDKARSLGVEVRVLPFAPELAALGDSNLRTRTGVSGWWQLARRLVTALPALRHYVRRLAADVNVVAPDLIYSNGIKTHLLLRLAGIRQLPVLWHIHDFTSERPLIRRLLGWAVSPNVSALAISNAVAKDLLKVAPKLSVIVVLNAIDVEHFSPGPGDTVWLDRAAGFETGPAAIVRIGIVAAYARWKGQDLFLRSAAQVLSAKNLPPVRFYIIGGPLYKTVGSQFDREELRALAVQLNVEHQVGFVDFQADPVCGYRALDIVVHASTRPEPFGLTIIEGMACARAVVAVEAGGAAELFTPNVDALGIPPNSAEHLAVALLNLIQDPERRQLLGAGARRTVMERFNSIRLPEQLLNVVQACTHKRELTSPQGSFNG